MKKETKSERQNLMIYLLVVEVAKLMEENCGNSGENFYNRFKNEFGNPPWEQTPTHPKKK